MPLPGFVRSGLSAWRQVAGNDTALEQWAKKRYLHYVSSQLRRDRGRGWVQWSGRRFVIVSESDDLPEPRRGIVLQGGCDLPSMFTVAPLIRQGIRGTVAIAKVTSGGAGRHRMDQIVQTLDPIPEAHTREVKEKLRLRQDYFEPILFRDMFAIPDQPQFGQFPQTVVVMSIATDLTRTAYAHNRYGFTVDPGGWWLNQSLDRVLDDLSAVDWFRSNFRSVGKLTVEKFQESVALVVPELRERINSKVMIYNSLVIEPGNQTHNYQLIKNPHSARRRSFAVALAEASRALDFHIVDVDRILKTEGVREQIDFAHFPVERMAPIGKEAARILGEMEVA
jgi:hypothetical protein